MQTGRNDIDDMIVHEKATKHRAVVFVTDAGFLIPSLVAAEQVASQSKVVAIADVIVVTIDFDAATLATLAQEFAATPIRFTNLASASFLPPEGTHFNPTHVPRSALARLALDEALPAHYSHIVYLDGDVLVVGDIAPFVAHDVAPGHILAGNDHLFLRENDISKFWRLHRNYLDGLGVGPATDYFNSGVLAFRRDSWREIAPKALKYFTSNAMRAIYHDQSALNAVCKGRREVLPPRYNFITAYADLGFEDVVEPAIIHFNGSGKPWFYSGPPWNGRFVPIYADFFARRPALAGRLPMPSAEKVVRIGDVARTRQRRERLITPWRRTFRERRLRRYIARTAFAL